MAAETSQQATAAEEAKYDEMLELGYKTLLEKNPEKAITNYLNPVIDHCQKLYGNSTQKIYSARTKAETLYYLMLSSSKKENARVVSPTCAEAIYMKGYASIDLGKLDDAKTYIEQALVLSPANPPYLSELGHIYQMQKNWPEAIKTFREAEENAKAYSPENLKEAELLRAMRGVGFALTELGQYQEAEQKYLQCLEINKNDKIALYELGYVRKLIQQHKI